MNILVLIGRFFYSAIFITSSLGHFTKQAIEFGTSHGVPMASFFVPFSGIIGIVGGLSILLGYKARLGAWLIVIFLIPVTLVMHKFWGVDDPVWVSMQQAMFMKNFSMLGAALLITYFGSGPLSLDKGKK